MTTAALHDTNAGLHYLNTLWDWQGVFKDKDRRVIRPATPAKRTRRTSIFRLVKKLRAAGERVVVEQEKDGTTRIICSDENSEASDNYWDEKLRKLK